MAGVREFVVVLALVASAWGQVDVPAKRVPAESVWRRSKREHWSRKRW